jgi:hypothetical protein
MADLCPGSQTLPLCRCQLARSAGIIGPVDWSGSVVQIGTGVVEKSEDGLRLGLPSATKTRYSDAQVDDTAGRRRRRFLWRPPLRLTLRARFSHPADELLGTAGFGFWNVPFGPGLGMVPALPRALWFFFGSPPHNLPLAYGVPGRGWKAACLDAGRPAALAWAPWAPLALLAMQSRAVYRWLWPHIQRSLGISEAVVPGDLTRWRRYILEWHPHAADFWVDDSLVLRAPSAPRGPLGFVAWMDNQYAVATPRGRFGWGLLQVPEPQWLEISDLQIG